MKHYGLLLVIITVLVGCSTNKRAPIEKLGSDFDGPNPPKVVTLKGKKRQVVLDFMASVQKVRDHLKKTWVEITEPGASCEVTLGINDQAELEDYSYSNCDFENELIQTMETSNKFPINRNELAALPSSFKITLTNPVKKN